MKTLRTPFGMLWNEGFMVCHLECYHLPLGGSSFELMAQQMAMPREFTCDVQLRPGVLWAIGGRNMPANQFYCECQR